MVTAAPLTRKDPHIIDTRALDTQVLPHVFKPGRYVGLEQGAYRKPFFHAKVTMALAFPDLYEIGISNHALKMFYSLINQQPNYMCDRVYAPATDMKEKLAEHNIPLYGVESMMPLADFDMLAFTLQYELNYTTIFGLLESANIPLRSIDRQGEEYPILMAGGPGSANPMPLAPFFDAFIIGDGEEVLLEILSVIEKYKEKGIGKQATLEALAELEGLFIPGITEKAYKRIVDIAEHQIEVAPLIPYVEAVHDRVVVEARRGCDRMCRFCQPCFINLPVREQSLDNIKKSALDNLEKTGYEECSLLSLSIADFSYLKPLVMGVSETLKEKNVSLSLPSQRADRFNVEVAEAVQSVRKSTLTFAPEAGTERLRNVINKNLTDAEIMNAVTTAYQSGWNKVKLYFILGLPTETNEDLDGIVDIVRRMKQTCLEMKRDKSLSLKGHLDVNVTLSNFVPKPHTPFQWFPQDSMDTLAQKIQYLRDAFRGMKGVKLNFTDPQISKLEAVISKGGPELADALEGAYRKGAYLDAWDDILNFDKWFAAMDELGMDPEEYTRCRFTNPDEPVPWDVVDMGLSKEWLKTEYERAREAMGTTPCFEECSACGVCGTYSTWPKFIENPYMEEEKTAASVPAVKDAVDAIKPVADLKKPPVCKVRVAIQKKKSVKFLSHLDWLRMFQRALTRSGLPVAYTQGFNPKHKISFGPALSLGVESDGEYIDVFLSSHVTGIADQVNVYLPENGKIISEAVLPLSEPKIDKSIRQMTYTARWTCKDPAKAYMMEERIQQMRSQSDIPMDIETKTSKKSFNLSQYLSDIQFEKDKNDIIVHMTLDVGFTDEGQPIIIKPQWVLDVIEKDTHSASALEWSICRTQIMLKETQKQLVTA